MKVQAIIAAAGTGERLKADAPKPFVAINGKPLFLYALEAFDRCPDIDSIILVGQPERLGEYKALAVETGSSKTVTVVAGGSTRRASVANGLAAADEDTDIVAVHDGARPLVTSDVIRDAIALCRDNDAVVTAVRVKPTIKKVDYGTMTVSETLDRDSLWEVQTPQVFKKDILARAHRDNTIDNPCDDAVLVERLGVKVKVSPGDYGNIKITTDEDLTVAEAFLKSRGPVALNK